MEDEIIPPVAAPSAEVLQNGKTELEQIDDLYSECQGIKIREITILRLQELFVSKQLTSVELTKCYLERIEHFNKILKCVVEVNRDAINQATKADMERNESCDRNLMHGIPILIKDNVATDDDMLTTAGSLALVNCRPKSDADVVKLLREAGAVILGKANVSEFSHFRGIDIPDGWSGRGGQTKNPYNLKESPEGSSSGSAVSVASNLVTVSIGTETNGSLLAPASVAGIFAMKPTYGLVSTKGIIPVSHNQDTVGPMARTVMDLAILLDAMIPADVKSKLDGRSYCQRVTEETHKEKFRLGVIRNPYWIINSINLQYQLPHLESILLGLKHSSEFEILDSLDPTGLENSVSLSKETKVFLHDFKHGINEYLKNEVLAPVPFKYPSPTCLKDIIQFNEENPTPEDYDQQLLILAERTDGLDNSTYIEYRDSNRATARELLDSLLIKYQLDALIFPSECKHEEILGKPLFDEKFKNSQLAGYSLAAIAGYPSINLPAGIGLKGVPYGLTFVALPHQEITLLQMAYLFERMYNKRTKPRFVR